jgi:hypothetical protein
LEANPNLTDTSLSEPSQQVIDAVQLQVVHAISGRIRIRTIDGNWNEQIEHLSQELKQQSWVLKVADNKNRGSLIFTFDENQLPLPQVLQVLTEFDVKYSPSTTKLDLAAYKSPDFWQKQSYSIIPLIAGLLVTRGLRVAGWPAIIVYMIAADGTRWLMDSFKPGLLTLAMSKTAEKLTAKEIPLPGLKTVQTTSTKKTTTPEKIDYKIVHQIPGRVRFHLPQITQDTAYCKRLEKLLKNEAAVSNFRLNISAASLVINYHNSDHHSEISVSHWVKLMELALLTEIPPSKISTPKISTPEILNNTPEETTELRLFEEENIDTIDINLSNL